MGPDAAAGPKAAAQRAVGDSFGFRAARRIPADLNPIPTVALAGAYPWPGTSSPHRRASGAMRAAALRAAGADRLERWTLVFGSKRVWLASVAAFAVGSMLCTAPFGRTC
jgi:hypothetical protein